MHPLTWYFKQERMYLSNITNTSLNPIKYLCIDAECPAVLGGQAAPGAALTWFHLQENNF